MQDYLDMKTLPLTLGHEVITAYIYQDIGMLKENIFLNKSQS